MHNGTRPRKKLTVEKEEAFEHAHSGLPVSLGRSLFSYEQE